MQAYESASSPQAMVAARTELDQNPCVTPVMARKEKTVRVAASAVRFHLCARIGTDGRCVRAVAGQKGAPPSVQVAAVFVPSGRRAHARKVRSLARSVVIRFMRSIAVMDSSTPPSRRDELRKSEGEVFERLPLRCAGGAPAGGALIDGVTASSGAAK